MTALTREQKKQLGAARNKVLDLMAKRKSVDALMRWAERELNELDAQTREIHDLLSTVENVQSPK